MVLVLGGLAKIGRIIGNFIPILIVGSLIGTASGYLLGLGINYLMNLEINGKSLIDYARVFVYDLWTSIFD